MANSVRDRLDHPVVDADAHWQEPIPVFLDYLADEGGPAMVDRFHAYYAKADSAWYEATPEERRAKRIKRRAWFSEPGRTLDRATSMLPGLMHERLPELGIDFAIVFPTLGIVSTRYADPELRRHAARALNRMNWELLSPYADRMTPAASIPTFTPEEAVDELRYCVETLGYKAAAYGGTMVRQTAEGKSYVDTLGLDSLYDYDPLWQAAVDLRVMLCDHGGSFDWGDRQSPSNFVFNHVNHFAHALHAACRGIVLGGVARRFPTLPFAFLEGGAGFAAQLQLALIEHWEKRTPEVIDAYLRPTNIDTGKFAELYERYANGRLAGRADDVLASFSTASPFRSPRELNDREVDDIDDFGASGLDSKDAIRSLFASQFFFGAEADDKMTAMAFRPDMGLSLRPLFSSDIGHFDVLDMSEVLGEAWGLVERKLLNEEQFRQFTFANVVDMHTRLNPSFFAGTAVERAVAAL
ncbi:MAG: amidohydrolase family protein [Acidimicrobiia bacterium]